MIDSKVVVLPDGRQVIITTCGHCDGTGTCKRGLEIYSGERASCPDCILNIFKYYNEKTKKFIVRCAVCNGSGKVRL